MSELSPEAIDHLAKLSRLNLSGDEKKSFTEQLPKIISFIDQLSSVGKLHPQETNSPTPLAELRDDVESSEKLSLEDLERLAPAWRDSHVEVPAVFSEIES